MKIRLTAQELTWLQKTMSDVQLVTYDQDESSYLAHAANRIKYKLAPLVNLTQPERFLIRSIAGHRFQTLELVPTEERETVKGLLEKL